MNINLGLKIFSAAACIAMVGGCMGVGQDEAPEASVAEATIAERITVAASTAVSGGATAEIGTEQLAGIMEQIGCPKLANLFRDLGGMQGGFAKVDATQSLPQSFTDYLSCFGISSLTNPDDFDKAEEAFEDFESLIDCICGSNALSNLIAGRFTFAGFDATNSNAGGAGFNAGNSNAGGAGFNAGNSNAGGSGFNASSSNAGGSGFSAK